MKKFLKIILSVIPFKKQIFIIVKALFHPSEIVFRHLYFKDKITIKVNSKIAFKMYHFGFQVENEIFWKGLFGGWEKDSLKIWSKLCEKSNVICDIGANTGVYALLAKAVNSMSRVIAFEPVTRVYQKLLRNIEINDYIVETSNFALSNFNGKAVIYDTLSEHTYSVTVNKNTQSEGVATIKTKIDTIRLDTFCELNQIDKIDLMKIDVETHEPEVIEGYGELLSEHRPLILIEILTDEIGGKIQTVFSNLNYIYYEVPENGVIKRTSFIIKGQKWNYFLIPIENQLFFQEILNEINLTLEIRN